MLKADGVQNRNGPPSLGSHLFGQVRPEEGAADIHHILPAKPQSCSNLRMKAAAELFLGLLSHFKLQAVELREQLHLEPTATR